MRLRLFLLVTIICAFSSACFARDKESRAIKEMLREGIKAQIEHRFDKSQVLDINPFLDVRCNDGLKFATTVARKHSPEVGFHLSIERIGNDTMIVCRNDKHVPVDAYYCTNRFKNQEQLAVYIHYLLAGNYMLANGKNSVFGLWQDFYEGSKYNTDPGIFQIHKAENDTIEISYGGGRVSHGDPKSPKYGKMRGGGGAGAIMGPMIWRLKLTTSGLEAIVARDEEFVNHSPRLEKGINVLTKAQCPWQGIDGRWAFTSVMPLTPALLNLFPKEVLELMRAEIYARHGDTFKDVEQQSYFDAQPWYKKSDKPVELTDIEQFNADIIEQVIENYQCRIHY